MRCFQHPQNDAFGTCKHCGRGVCGECSADLPIGLACRDRCEGAVAAVHALVARNLAVNGKVGVAHWAQLLGFGGAALVLGVFAVVLSTGDEWIVALPLGGGALFFAAYTLSTVRWMRTRPARVAVAGGATQ